MIKLIGPFFIGLVVACLGFFLQMYQIGQFPPIGDTMDEHKGAFNGISLITNGVPKSWSWFGQYPQSPIQIVNGHQFMFVEPYFDDPPLFALVSGAFAISKGMTSFETVDVATLRLMMPFFGFINILLLFSIVFLLKGIWEATLAGLLYATIPTMVMAARLPIADNAIATCMLGALLFFILYSKKRQFRFLFLAGLISGVAFLVKSTGIFIPVSLFLLSFALKDKRAMITFVSTIFIAISLWLLYGFYYNWQLFVSLIPAYSGRALFLPSPIINLFEVFRIGISQMDPDGWIIWGWLSVIFISFLKDSEEPVLKRLAFPVTIGSYLVFFTIMSGFTYGWYRFPFYPLLAWAAAELIIQIIKQPRFLLIFFFITIPFFSSYIYGTGETFWGKLEITNFQMVFIFLMAPVMIYEITKKLTFLYISRIIMINAVIISIIFNILTILFYQQIFWHSNYFRTIL